MRRTLAAALLGISLWIGSLAWTGFVLTRTVLDPDRSEEVARALYEDEAVRAQLAENVADALQAALPPNAPVDRAALENAAETALDSRAVEAVFVDAFARTHAAFLGEGRAPRAVEVGALGDAARTAILEDRPGLDASLPETPDLRVPLPTERIPNLGPVRDVLSALVPALAGVAAAGALVSLGVTSNRPAVVRRAGVWAIGLSAVVLFFSYGVPAIAERVAPDQAEIVAALIDAMAATTRGPALGLAAAGGGAVGLSFLWRSAPAALRATTGGGAGAAGDAAPARVGPGAGTPRAGRTGRRDIPTPHRRRPDPGPVPQRASPEPSSPEPRSPEPRSPTSVDAGAVGDAAAARSGRWVDGVGWVLEPSEVIPAEARWVPGVGYVVPRD